VEIHNEQNHLDVDLPRIMRAIAAAAGEEDPSISVSIVGNEAIQAVNREHLGRDEPTDVIAFDYGEDIPGEGEDVEGEVIVSAERAVEAAAELGRAPGDELLLYIVHGVLHLRGFDDRDPEQRAAMRERERAVCLDLGLGDPWPNVAGGEQGESGQPVVVFTDGACRGNPGPGGWGIRVLYPDGRVLEKGGGSANTTNNRMELRAAIEALNLVGGEGRAVVMTDSEYVRLGITRWVEGWKARGWKTVKGGEVRNRDLWEALSGLMGPHVEWRWVEGHAGDPDNERCDRIAVAFAEGRSLDLADGIVPENGESSSPRNKLSGTELGSRKPRKGRSRKKGGHYLSMVDGSVHRHLTWADCEARVKGVSRARYKKCFDRSEEEEILRSWGIDPACARIEGPDQP
jgi:ribonuclease HI